MPTGFIFGEKDNQWVVKPEIADGHVLVVGGAGSGKSSCIAIPSLMCWKERVFAIDIKGELYKNTRHRRRNIRVFDPLDTSAYGYDPFYLLSKTDNQAQEAEAIAHALIPKPPNTNQPFWIDSARNLLIGMILHFYNLGYSFIDTIVKIQSTPIGELIDTIADTTTTQDAIFYINTFTHMENETLTSVYAELSNHIMIFATDKNIKECLSRTKKITPNDLEHKNDVFICIPQHLLRQWKNLLTLLVSQFLRHFERRPDQKGDYILFLLDEFPFLGKINVIIDGLATLRSKRITFCPIIQSLGQLDLTYGKEARQVIADNCDYQAVLRATDPESQRYFSEKVGTYEPIRFSTSQNVNHHSFFGSSSGISTHTEEKRRMKPELFATLGGNLALFTPFGFMMIEKTPYYKHNF